MFTISQKAKVYTYDYPYAESLNPKLHRIIFEKAITEDLGAKMTDWNCFNIKEFKLISNYVLNLQKEYALLSSPSCRWYLELKDLWGQVYNEGDFQESHDHVPNHWSFVYYVNTPRGSSPLVFESSGKKFRLKAGQVIIFPAWLKHNVPPNKCEGRMIIGGNMFYKVGRNDWGEDSSG